MCTEFLSCRIAAHRGPLTVETRKGGVGPSGREWFEVVAEPGVLGSVTVRRLTAWDGRELVYVDGFSGGACVGQWRSVDDAAQGVAAHARRSAGSWTYALHG